MDEHYLVCDLKISETINQFLILFAFLRNHWLAKIGDQLVVCVVNKMLSNFDLLWNEQPIVVEKVFDSRLTLITRVKRVFASDLG